MYPITQPQTKCSTNVHLKVLQQITKSRKRKFSIKYFRLIERIQTIESIDEKDEWF